MITLAENNNVTESLVESIYTPNSTYFDNLTSNMGMENNSEVLDALKWKFTQDQGHGTKKVLSILENDVTVGLIEGLVEGSVAHTSINLSLKPFKDFAAPLHTYLKSIGVNKLIAWAKPSSTDEADLLNALDQSSLYEVVDNQTSTFLDSDIEHSFITLDLL